MRVGLQRVRRCASVAAVVAGVVVAGAVPVSASGKPSAGISINAVHEGLQVTFVARSLGFSSKVVSYAWTFGDGGSKETSTSTVTHSYPSASTFSPTVTETDTTGDTATAAGTVALFDCPAGTMQCTEALPNAGTVQLLQASGPVAPSSPADLDLFVGPFRILNCEAEIAPAVALTDTGFTGSIRVMVKYTTSRPKQVGTTCFSSPVAFVDATGRSVHSGALPTCQPNAPTPPCVQSIQTSGAEVTKVLLIPPGDPKVGAP